MFTHSSQLPVLACSPNQSAEAQSALDLHERRRLTASRDLEAHARAALQRECAQLSAALAQQHRDSAAQLVAAMLRRRAADAHNGAQLAAVRAACDRAAAETAAQV